MAKPKKRFRSGGVRAAVWVNERTTSEGIFRAESITFSRRYKKSDGQWDSTGVFRKNDLPKLEVVLRQVYEFLNTKEIQQESKGKSSGREG
jgi:hypothetical protein